MARRPGKSTTAKPSGTPRRMAKVLSIRAAPSEPPDAAAGSQPTLEDEFNKLQIADITMDVPLRPFEPKRRVPTTPFHFLSLPSELRIKIYDYYFQDITGVLDLAPENHKKIHGKLRLMRVCRQVHSEATYLFYSTRTFRMFPTHPGRYFKTKKPLLARMKPVPRNNMTKLELRLGPGWSQPPKGWVVNDALGLRDCINVRTLRVFVECDPSDNIFKGFRQSESFYEGFCRKLLNAVLEQMPAIETIEFDAWPSVKKKGAMMTMLLDVASQSEKRVVWGAMRGWTDNMDEDDEKPSQFVNGVSIPGYGPHNVLVLA